MMISNSREMYELKICRDYRDGKVTKENLDKCSTCDMNCVINNGLSEASEEQLKHKIGEKIVDLEYKRRVGTKEEHENESVYFVDAKGW